MWDHGPSYETGSSIRRPARRSLHRSLDRSGRPRQLLLESPELGAEKHEHHRLGGSRDSSGTPTANKDADLAEEISGPQ
jgi:hypothetical protein